MTLNLSFNSIFVTMVQQLFHTIVQYETLDNNKKLENAIYGFLPVHALIRMSGAG